MKLAVRDVFNLLPVLGGGKLFTLRQTLHIYLISTNVLILDFSHSGSAYAANHACIDVKLDVISCKTMSSDFR